MDSQTLVEKAEGYLKTGQYTKAVELWNKVVKQFPNTPQSAYSESQIQRYGNLSETLYEIPIGPFTWRALDKKDIKRIGYVVYILIAFIGGVALENGTGFKGAYIAVFLFPILFAPFYGKISNWPKGSAVNTYRES
jgi:hypothetical protein